MPDDPDEVRGDPAAMVDLADTLLSASGDLHKATEVVAHPAVSSESFPDIAWGRILQRLYEEIAELAEPAVRNIATVTGDNADRVLQVTALMTRTDEAVAADIDTTSRPSSGAW